MLTPEEKRVYRNLRDLAVGNKIVLYGLVGYLCERWSWRNEELEQVLDNLAKANLIRLDGTVPDSRYDAITILESPKPPQPTPKQV